MARVYKPPPTSAFAVIGSLLAGSVAAMIGVAPYAYFVTYMPFVYLNGVACICYGALVGSAVGHTATRLKLANRRSAALVGASAGVLGLYVAWCVSRMAQLSRLSNNAVDFTLNPIEVYRFALFYYEHGLWSVGTSPNTQSPPIQGFRLVWFWLCEAGVILGFGAGVPLRRVGDRVFLQSMPSMGHGRAGHKSAIR